MSTASQSHSSSLFRPARTGRRGRSHGASTFHGVWNGRADAVGVLGVSDHGHAANLFGTAPAPQRGILSPARTRLRRSELFGPERGTSLNLFGAPDRHDGR